MRSTIIIIVAILSMNVSGQFYPLEAGAVLGGSSGFSFRAYLDEDLSYEALLSFRNQGAQIHLFRQQHNEIYMTKEGSLHFVYGYGAHLGFYYTDHYTIFFNDIYFGRNLFSPAAGVDGYSGLEYRFHELPLSFTLSYKPYMELSLRQIFGINLWDFGLTVKYRFKPQNNYF
ncbi:hypothetical protein ACFLRQ_00565 [Bacteroidota bacterium]